ncbi:MAG TPA: GNAT family N-acetyltransferase [Candidatus Acidoferrales bacterium]|nr:GNAT family N-acetyltransferase [Candidatus Acidoferrales bacterium]
METWSRDDYTISTDRSALDVDAVYGYLSKESYWATGIARDVVERSLQNSLCFGLYRGDAQIGFTRVVTDYATMAYVGDVYVLPEHRGRGLSKWMMECVLAHSALQHLRRWILVTRDAHGLYRKFGFTGLKRPEGYMELHNPDIYRT